MYAVVGFIALVTADLVVHLQPFWLRSLGRAVVTVGLISPFAWYFSKRDQKSSATGGRPLLEDSPKL
jgi:hypothetical protein